jgi:CheY-like chemotaxis protein
MPLGGAIVGPSRMKIDTTLPSSSSGTAVAFARCMKLKNLAVLVLEEDPSAREVMEVALRTEGATVRSAASAESALRLLQARWRPNVLVADISPRDRWGCSLLRTIRKMGISAPAMAVTGEGTESSADAFDAGFQVHVSKPVARDKLVFLVERMGRE